MPLYGLIGYGAVARACLDGIGAPADPAGLVTLCEPGRSASAQEVLQGFDVAVVDRLEDLIALKPDAVAECAGHQALTELGPAILQAGIDLIVISSGALADATLEQALMTAAQQGGAQLALPSGAIGGIDALAAARLAGLDSVTYRCRKPPEAWRGSPAEQQLDLAGLIEPTVFYRGTARAAAKDYPKNVNVAATVALAGLGFEATRVELVADPALDDNIHEVSVRGKAGYFDISLAGYPSPLNPKTSLLTGYSVARALLNRHARLAI